MTSPDYGPRPPVGRIPPAARPVTTARHWETVTWDDGDHVHVLPLGDGVEHEERDDGECVCGPAVEYVAHPDDSCAGWVYVHASVDGRELRERTR